MIETDKDAVSRPPDAASPPEPAASPAWKIAQAPAPFVLRFLAGVKPGGRVLDVASGTGRHVAAALDRGHLVTAVDRDTECLAALARLGDVETIAADLEDGSPWPLGGRRFDAVIVTNYLFRPILPAIMGAVAPDGLLVYETFGPGQERHGRPARKEFHLRANELLRPALEAGLVVVVFEQGELAGRYCSGGAAKIVQRIAAVGPEHPFAHDRPLALFDP